VGRLLSSGELEQIQEWMSKPGNLEKLKPLEAAVIQLELMKYQERIAPIIIRAMSRDKEATFLFKIGGSSNDRPEDERH
jgi:hypothetical protein